MPRLQLGAEHNNLSVVTPILYATTTVVKWMGAFRVLVVAYPSPSLNIAASFPGLNCSCSLLKFAVEVN